MIGKIRKGRSFGGCIRYVTQKDDAEIIASEGVLLGTAEETARSFRWQCLLSPDVAKPVGHIALSFKPEDAPRLTDAFMARLAEEYLELMGIRNTQFIVVRHHGTDNPMPHRLQPGGLRREGDFRQQRFQAQREGDENAQEEVFAHLFRRQTVR